MIAILVVFFVPFLSLMVEQFLTAEPSPSLVF